MFTFKKILTLSTIYCMVLFVSSCSKEQTNDKMGENPIQIENASSSKIDSPAKFETHIKDKSGSDAAEQILQDIRRPKNNMRVPVNYLEELCDGLVLTGNVASGSINNVGERAYYYFEGEAGDLVTIEVDRIDCEMDPFFELSFGMISDSDDFGTMSFVVFGDDEDSPACETCFAYFDPKEIDVLLPATGVYTLTVGDYISCDASTSYDYSLSFLSSGSTCTIEIDGCDTGVDNDNVDGQSMEDLIMDCASNANNHGQFVSCVAQLTNAWKSAGLITGEQKELIMECAAESNLP